MAEGRELRAALVRLQEETTANIGICDRVLPATAGMANSAHVVLRSLSSGELADEDVEKFDLGLAMMGWNPRPPFVSTVAEEMISIGLLKKLEDRELRSSVAELPGLILRVRGDIGARGANFQSALDELSRTVEFDYLGSTNLDELRGAIPIFEQGVTVEYDFESLSRNTYLKNLLIEATDTHTDRYGMINDLCKSLVQIDGLLSDTDAS